MKNKDLVSRRAVLTAGLTSLGALFLPGCSKPLPPTYGNLLRLGDNLTYVAQRALIPGQSLAREYSHSDISSFPAVGTTNPGDPNFKWYSEDYAKLHRQSFADWKIKVDGRVTKPQSFTMQELQALPIQKQITKHTCEEGWSAIAEWSGVRLSTILNLAGILPDARFVNFYAYDGYKDSIDMLDAFHPQTILAYGMNGKNLAVPHGAPIRLRVESQIGYKSLKYLNRIEVVDKFDDFGQDGLIQNGWSWYAGI